MGLFVFLLWYILVTLNSILKIALGSFGVAPGSCQIPVNQAQLSKCELPYSWFPPAYFKTCRRTSCEVKEKKERKIGKQIRREMEIIKRYDWLNKLLYSSVGIGSSFSKIRSSEDERKFKNKTSSTYASDIVTSQKNDHQNLKIGLISLY